MPSRLLSAAFPTQTSYGMNFFDQTPTNLGGGGNPITPGWSGGAQLVTAIQRPSEVTKWTVLGWGVNFQAAHFLIPATGTPVPKFARLPKLYGGLARDSGLADGVPHPFSGLPSDASLIDLLWDGQSDPPPPAATSQSPFVPGAQSMSQHSAVLPTPVELDEGDTLAIGFWLTPMLGQNVRLWYFRANYTIMYDPTT